MKKLNRFDKAYNSLVRAYFEGTLAKGSCSACAVGNIIADAMGGTLTQDGIGEYFECDKPNKQWVDMLTEDCEIAEREVIELTGYNHSDIQRIERAFENNTSIYYTGYQNHSEQEILEDQFNGLQAVVEVMLELDGMKDEGHIAKFKEHPQYETKSA